MNFTPEMLAFAQKQMESMSPEQLAEMQRMAMQMDPSKLAAMGLDPSMAKQAQQQFANLSPDDMARAREQACLERQMKNMSPEDMQKQFQQQQSTVTGQREYYYKASMMLKNDGNDLVKAGKFAQAEEKYRRAVTNLESDITPAGKELRTACQLNLALCLLKLSKPEEAEKHCSEVLRTDKNSLKAYFRRGQARLQRGSLQDAAADLRKAAAISPGDETVQNSLKECLDKMQKAGIVEDASAATPDPEPVEELVTPAAAAAAAANGGFAGRSPEETKKAVEELKKNPEMLKNMGEMMGNMSEEQLKMLSQNRIPGMPEVTPEMAKQAAEMMKKMSPEDMSRMMEMAEKMGPLAGAAGAGGERAASGAAASSGAGGMPQMTPEMMAQMGETMKDPKMMEMVSEMMKDMSPETLAAMSKSAGLNLSEEQARAMAEQMKNIKPEQMAKLMAAATVMQKAYQRFVQAREWARRNKALLLVLAVVLLAFIVQWVALRRSARRELEAALAAKAAAGVRGAAGAQGGEEEEDPFAAGGAGAAAAAAAAW